MVVEINGFLIPVERVEDNVKVRYVRKGEMPDVAFREIIKPNHSHEASSPNQTLPED